MARSTSQRQQASGQRAAIYARVSDKSQDTEDKTSISEQISDMEAHCQRRGLTITARYQEVGRGWSKNRPEFQRMLAAARRGRFDTIVCWKSDRLSRGMYPAAALMQVVDAYQIELEAVMDAIDMKTFGLMAAIGKIELDNFRERASMGKRGSAKQGRIPVNNVPYGYRLGEDRRPQAAGRGGRGHPPRLPHVRPRRVGGSRHCQAVDRRGRSHAQSRRTMVRRHRYSHLESRGLQGHLVVRQGPPRLHRARDEEIRPAGGRVGRGSLPARGGRRDLGTGAGSQEAPADPVGPQHQALLSFAASGQVRRVRVPHGLPDHQALRVGEDHRESARPSAQVHHGTAGDAPDEPG